MAEPPRKMSRPPNLLQCSIHHDSEMTAADGGETPPNDAPRIVNKVSFSAIATTNLSSVGERKKLSPWLQCYSGRMQSMLHHICACFLHVCVVSHSHGHPLKHRCLHGCCCPPNCIPNYDWGPNLRVTRFPSDPTKRALWTRTNLERTCQLSDTRYIYDWMYTNKINLDSSVYRPVL